MWRALSWFGSVLDIGATMMPRPRAFTRRRAPPTLTVEEQLKADQERLAADWEKVGQDFEGTP